MEADDQILTILSNAISQTTEWFIVYSTTNHSTGCGLLLSRPRSLMRTSTEM